MKRNGTATEWGRVRAGVLTGRGPASREKARHDRRCSLSAASVVTSPPREQSRAELAEGQRRMLACFARRWTRPCLLGLLLFCCRSKSKWPWVGWRLSIRRRMV